jgi:hypothetical protein
MHELKDSSKNRQADFNVAKYEKFTDSDSTLHSTLRNYNFQVLDLTSKNAQNYLKRPLR